MTDPKRQEPDHLKDKKQSIRRIIMRKFISCSIGIWLALFLIELFLSLATADTRWDFSERVFEAGSSVDLITVLLGLIWIVIVAAVYLLGVRRFGRDISRKIAEPVRHMAEGFREVTAGSLDTVLRFETETEFREMRDAFNLMVHRLKESEEKRQTLENERMQLFSHIAHDLKTPLTTLAGYAGALADGLVADPEKQREYHLAMKAKSIRLNQLTDQLLSYAKLGTAQYQMYFADTDIVELVRAACASLFGEIEKNRMKLELLLPDEQIFCPLDALEISRAVYNLLTNAIRHNPSDTLIQVSLAVTPERVMLQIADDGPPIPEAIEKNLFEPFISGDDSRSTGSGTGLGLAIVKKIMAQHSGDTSVIKTPPPCTKAFLLSLPRPRPAATLKS